MTPDRSLRFLLRGLCLVCLALPSIAAAEQAVAVSFEFPDRPAVRITVTYSEVVPLIHDKLAYKVEFWVYGALAKARLTYAEETHDRARVITAIDGVRNDSGGRWVYFVNGIRSRYHINTQSAQDVRSIRFVFERSPKGE